MLTTYLGICSILIGFAFFGSCFYCFSTNKSRKLCILLLLCAFVFMTIIPVTLAVGFASISN